MRYLIIIAAVLALAGTAQAGSPNLCVKDGWTTAQSSSGQSFASMKECAKAREVFQPSLVLTPTTLGPNSEIEIRGSGFHSFTTLTLTLAVTGQPPYWSEPHVGSFSDGSVQVWVSFGECGAGAPWDLTFTLTDSFGVRASAEFTLC